MQFELYEDTVIYTNGVVGAILDTDSGQWYSFSYFDSGDIQINEEVNYWTPDEAYERAKEYYS